MKKKRAIIHIYKGLSIGTIERELFGSFVEHMGRSIYGGLFEEGSKFADEDGFRKDVMALVRELGVSVVRYPGGNFLSNYRWRDGIGSREKRPARLDVAWAQTEPNLVGIHEFVRWAEKVGTKVMLGVNLGTGSISSAADLVEYCNHPGGTALSEERAANGRREPFGIGYWCLGNEMDGDWQAGAKTAEEYGRVAHEGAKLMKWIDPSVKLTVCGSSGSAMTTYPMWDRVVLEHTYEDVDFLSLHKYYEYPGCDRARRSDFLASFLDFDAFIKTGKATIAYVKALRRSKRQVYLSVDEWNIWHTEKCCDADRWTVGARRLENRYDAVDAVVFASLMMTLINNADCVKMACLAQLINVIAPIFADGEREALKQTIFYPFLMGTRYAKGRAMRTCVETDSFPSIYGEAPVVYTAAAYDEASGTISVFLVNNGEAGRVSICLRDFGKTEPAGSEVLVYGDPSDRNDFDARDRVKMKAGGDAEEEGEGDYTFAMPGLTFAVVHFKEVK